MGEKGVAKDFWGIFQIQFREPFGPGGDRGKPRTQELTEKAGATPVLAKPGANETQAGRVFTKTGIFMCSFPAPYM